MMPYKPRPRCRHPGCLSMSVRQSAYCPYHRDAYGAASKAAKADYEDQRSQKRRKQRLAAAIALCRKNGYTVEARHQPEAFPS